MSRQRGNVHALRQKKCGTRITHRGLKQPLSKVNNAFGFEHGRYINLTRLVTLEMAYYFRLIFSRLEGDALFTFLPHFKEDPE